MGVDNNAKPKWLCLKGHNSVKNNFIATKTPHAHFHYIHKNIQGFKRPIENCGKSWLHKLYTVKRDERTDRQTDRQGQILMPPPDYGHEA